jgi:hypothetical protein
VKLVFGNFGTAATVSLSEASPENDMENSVTGFASFGTAIILLTSLVTPALAQAFIQERGLHAFYHPNGESRIGRKPTRRRDAVVTDRETANATALSPSFQRSMPGKETTTRPWSAPVGHRQPRPADVPASTSMSPNVLDQEDAIVDRKISSICRGC